MKHKGFWLRMIPVFFLVLATMLMSVEIYFQMIRTEEEVCWKRLEIATDNTSEKIRTRINDNLNFLTAVSDAYILTHDIYDLAAVGGYLDSVMEKTIFERIDVILPDESLITQTGESSERGGNSSYDQLVEKGTHITSRVTSSFTGEEVICCVTPIKDDDEVQGLLVGTISCRTLSKLFEVYTYGSAAQLFVIDCTDGSYLMDNWHDELGNIHEIGTRKSPDGDAVIDFVPAIINGDRARFAFVSQTNGEVSYQYCAPLEDFNWEVCVVIQEDVVFANVKALEKKLLKVGLAELLLVIIYVFWNISVNMVAARSEEQVKRLEYDKARNEARSKFISNMSHDIKTPLNGIVGMLQIIKNHRQDEEMVDDCLQKIEISANYLSTLTSDVLDISEIETDKLLLLEEPVDLKQMLDELSSMMERQAGAYGVTYESDCTQLENPHVIGSSVHIKRILVNLAGNAVKYSKNTGNSVCVTVSDESMAHEPEKRMYRFVIKDNGIGMSEEFQKNMFLAFEQETIDARSEYQGYGLGLTIVNHLVRKMKGSIEVESTKGVGSTFTVSIPLPVNVNTGIMEETEEKRISLSGLRILLVEDNEFNMEIANILLKDAGAVVDTAVNGELATEMFANSALNQYDAILMDVMMPVMDGCEAAKLIRQMNRPDAKTIPIIAMTASTFSEDVTRCIEAGMNIHLPKPLEIKHLLVTLMNYCKQS